jgi:hypothetical protein
MIRVRKIRLDRRYRKYVPKDIRRLGENRGVPKPNRYVPSAHGAAIGPIARIAASRRSGAADDSTALDA